MSKTKVDTTIDELINVIKATESDPRKFNALIKSIESTIPVKRGKRNMPTKIDQNLNKKFRIKRINYNVIAKITGIDSELSMYNANVISVEMTGDFHPKVLAGDNLLISKRELQLTAQLV